MSDFIHFGSARTIVRKLDARCLENEGKLHPEIADSMRTSLILAQFAFFMTGIGHNLHTIHNALRYLSKQSITTISIHLYKSDDEVVLVLSTNCR